MKQLLAFILFVALWSCKKNEAGGNASVTGNVSHHGRAIPHAKVFVKYDAREFPGPDTSIYNNHVSADASGNYTFACYKGDYYLFARSVENGTVVTGGVPAHVRAKEVVKADIAVSENH